MMGAGKSTLGSRLAHQLEYRFFDTDTIIERVAQKTVRQIFADSGEDAFRDLESQVLAELAAYTRSVFATGGGIVLKQKNWSYLRHGVIVWLDAPVEVLAARLQSDTQRPLLQEADPVEKLRSLLEQRKALYSQADVHIAYAPDESIEQTCDRVLKGIEPVLMQPQLFDNGN
ncbi:MAG TPA: shikimate kinase [Leptolyngbyaceae cyanobacterium M33_DOE_097]|uniref:Shikimate kinase n=1 Tax=Oscillatoriales cyanobacterium SpSt-418 TaxID=2282169 RepID=A0A7C3KF64_9CYAN|nr:shikimate kinase [Leptolyngbyaceae cyanobacterium M33_DOE_097]